MFQVEGILQPKIVYSSPFEITYNTCVQVMFATMFPLNGQCYCNKCDEDTSFIYNHSIYCTLKYETWNLNPPCEHLYQTNFFQSLSKLAMKPIGRISPQCWNCCRVHPWRWVTIFGKEILEKRKTHTLDRVINTSIKGLISP